jgi:hypothetical protein
MTNVEGNHLELWKRLTGQLALAGADAGEHRTTAPSPETLAGVIERVQQDEQQRLLVLRMEAPAPGVAIVGTFATGKLVTLGVSLYFYGGDAAERATASEQKWQSWIADRFAATEVS